MCNVIPIVFLDTCVFKAAVRFGVYGEKIEHRNDDGELKGVSIPLVWKTYNDAMREGEQRDEHECVEEVAQLVHRHVVRAVTSQEVMLELMSLPKTFPAAGGKLYGAEVQHVSAPTQFGYSLTSWKEDLRAQLLALEDARYFEIRRQVGAYQGKYKVSTNSLIDALLLWTAEVAGCNFFLTVEKKLLKYKFYSDTLAIIRPSQLIEKFR